MSSFDKRFPYPGLRSYESEESDLFFGREGCVDDMLERLAATSFLAVLGTSGSGKSSLVRTGLLDALELGFLPGRNSEWLVADMHPGGRPIHNLARVLVELDGGEINDIELSLMKSFMTRGPRSLIQWCDDAGLRDDQSLILIVDQFEELFRYRDYAGREEAEAFVGLLLESAKSDTRIHIVITMRSEFLGACAMMPGLAEQINSGLYLTNRMNRAECEEAIRGPASVIGIEVESRLVSEILNDMASLAPWDKDDALTSLEQISRRADQLPLMQHVLNRLYGLAKSDDGNVILSLDDYIAIGRLRGAINAHAEEVLDGLSESARGVAEPVFRSLVNGTNLSNAVREPKRFQDLVEIAHGDREAVMLLINAFRAQGCSFLRPPISVPLENDTIIDLGHESLIRQWSQLGDWLAEEARDAATWSRVVTAQTARSQNEGDLLSGLDLANARSWWSIANPTSAWAARYGGDFGEVQTFMNESIEVDDLEKSKIKEGERLRTKRLRARAAAYLGLAVVSVGAALFGWNASLNERQAREEAVVAFDMADDALTTAQEANVLAISASETFLIDMTERLRRSFGVKPEDVQLMLDEGTAFLDRLDAQMPGNPNLRRARAKLLLEYAGFASDRSDYEASMAYLERTMLLFQDGGGPTSQDIILLVETEVARAGVHRRLFDYEAALEAANRAGELMDEFRPQMPKADQVLGSMLVSSVRSMSLGFLERYEEAEVEGRLCLEQTSKDDEARRIKSVRARCASILSYVLASKETQPTDETFAELESHISNLDDDQRDLDDWLNWLYFSGNVSYSKNLQDDLSGALLETQRLNERSQALVAAAPFNNRLRERYASSLQNLGFYHYRFGDLQESLNAYLEAVAQHEAMGEVLYSDEFFAESYRDALGDAYATLDDIENWGADRDTVALAADLTQKWYDQVLLMDAKGMDLCNSCLFEPPSFVSTVAEKQLGQGDPNGADTLLRVYDQYKDFFDGLDPNEMSEQAQIAARRALFWIATDLPSGATDRRAFEDAAKAITVFEGTVQRLEAFLDEYPQAAEVRYVLGGAYVELAELYNNAGRTFDAEQAIRRGVELENFHAIDLLLTWADKGDGPIARDPALASELSNVLAAREWTPRTIPVLLDELWTEEVEEKAATLFIRDVPVESDSAIDIAIAENETLMGRRISEESIARLKAWEQQASAAGKTFIRYYSQDVRNEAQDDLNGPAEIEFRLRQLAEANEVFNAAGVIYRQDIVLKRRSDIEEALSNLLSNRTEVGYVELLDFMVAVGDRLGQEPLPVQALLVYNAVLENADVLSVERQAELLTDRGTLFDMADQPEKSLENYLLALTLEPENPRLLNAVGYSLTEQDNRLGLSISILTKAVDLWPETSGTKQYPIDSLGWAYVRNGEIERGLELVKEAFIVGDDDQAEIMFHVAEAHRRLGADDKAVAAYLLAREYTGSAEIKEEIEAGLNRLGYFLNYSDQEIEDARQISAASTGLDTDFAVDSEGVALQGFDPVVLFENGELINGSTSHWSLHEGAIWLFGSAQSKLKFDSDASTYTPAHGGYCGYCLASSTSKVPGKPEHWTLTDGKIYLHASANNATNWSNSSEASVIQARDAWVTLQEQSSSETSPSHVAKLLNALSVGTEIRSVNDHITFATAEEVNGIRAALKERGDAQPAQDISVDKSGVAIGGYDTVAYHIDGQAKRGSFEHWSIWNGAFWLFETAANRIKFESDPKKYAPSFGGFCSYCLVGGSKSHGDPRYWVIMNGKVSLAISDRYRQLWIENHSENEEAASSNWEALSENSIEPVGRISWFAAAAIAMQAGANVKRVDW